VRIVDKRIIKPSIALLGYCDADLSPSTKPLLVKPFKFGRDNLNRAYVVLLILIR